MKTLLDLSDFMSIKENENENVPKYRLMSVIVHVSSSSGKSGRNGYNNSSYSIGNGREGGHGHYKCYVRGKQSDALNIWYLLDDNRIIRVSQDDVKMQAAYMLLYEQIIDDVM